MRSCPGSSSFSAEYAEKTAECDAVGAAMRRLLEKNILPRDIMTRAAFENAMVRSASAAAAAAVTDERTGSDVTCTMCMCMCRC